MRSPHSRVGNSAVSAAGYLKSPLQEVPLPPQPPLSFRSNNNGSTACQNFDGLQWGAVPGSGRTQHTPLAARCVPAKQSRYIQIYITYIAYIIYSYWLHYQARAAKSLQLNDLNKCFGRFTVYTCLSSPGAINTHDAYIPCHIQPPYTIYAIYVSGCPWSIREYIHSPSRSVCHFRANVFFHFPSTFSTLQINEHISGTLRF